MHKLNLIAKELEDVSIDDIGRPQKPVKTEGEV